MQIKVYISPVFANEHSPLHEIDKVTVEDNEIQNHATHYKGDSQTTLSELYKDKWNISQAIKTGSPSNSGFTFFMEKED